MIRRLWLFTSLALSQAAFHCGHGFPLVANLLEQPIALAVHYRSGQSVYFELPPHTTAIAPQNAIAIDQIEVRSAEKILFTIEKEELDRLRSDLPPGTRIVWEIHDTGVTPTVTPE